MNKTQSKISIVIPVYGVEKYIRQCLESVINQTYKDLEIIVVNDGTKDNSMRIVEEYLSDERIKVINKENGGLSSARNKGIEEATGEYIYFLDSDDWIELNTIERLVKYSKEVDIVGANFFFYNEEKKEKIKKKMKVVYGKQLLGMYNLQEDLEVIVCNKIYRLKYLKENIIKFIEKIIHEDEEFSIRNYIINSPKILYLEDFTYNYRIGRESSIMTNILKEKKIIYSIESLKKICDILKKELKGLKGNFQKIRLFLKITNLEIVILKRSEKKMNKKQLLNFEEELSKLYIESFTEYEKNILKKEIRDILLQKEMKGYNLFNKFYWKNDIVNIFNFRKMISRKLRD